MARPSCRPWITSPSMAKGRPNRRSTASTSPSRSARRMRVELMGSPFSSTGDQLNLYAQGRRSPGDPGQNRRRPSQSGNPPAGDEFGIHLLHQDLGDKVLRTHPPEAGKIRGDDPLHPQPFQGFFLLGLGLQQAEIPFGFWRTAHGGEGETQGIKPALWATAAPITAWCPRWTPQTAPRRWPTARRGGFPQRFCCNQRLSLP